MHTMTPWRLPLVLALSAAMTACAAPSDGDDDAEITEGAVAAFEWNAPVPDAPFRQPKLKAHVTKNIEFVLLGGNDYVSPTYEKGRLAQAASLGPHCVVLRDRKGSLSTTTPTELRGTQASTVVLDGSTVASARLIFEPNADGLESISCKRIALKARRPDLRVTFADVRDALASPGGGAYVVLDAFVGD